MEDLFNLGLGERVVGKRNAKDVFIQQAWQSWQDVTQRPSMPVDSRFAKACRDALEERIPQDRILRAVLGASYLRPKNRDPLDVRRVIQSISNRNIERQVLALMDGDGNPQYMWDVGDPQSNMCSLDDIVQSCGTPTEDWTSRDHECAGMILQSIDSEKLAKAAKRVKLHLGEDHILPSEIIRHSSVWRNPDKKVRVKTNATRDTYTSGRMESESFEGMDIGLDLASERALIKGCPSDLVGKHYMLAPAGYWKRVSQMADADPSASLKDIYQTIKISEQWHPDDRGELKW